MQFVVQNKKMVSEKKEEGDKVLAKKKKRD